MKYISVTKENNHNFDDIVNNNSAIIKFYSNHCDHCIAMKDDWNSLINDKHLNNYIGYIIAVESSALDNIKSDVKDNLLGFPTIIYKSKDGNVKKEYNGNRSKEDMMNFVKKYLKKKSSTTRKKKSSTTRKKKSSKKKTKTKSKSKKLSGFKIRSQ